MTTPTPFHEVATIAGITEACRFNDHSICNNPRCICDCHRPAARLAEPPAQVADQLQLKSCPKCNTKRPSFERFCRDCGSKLGSLQCLACSSICDPADNYCFGCGMPMSKAALKAAGAVSKPSATLEASAPPLEAPADDGAILRLIQQEVGADGGAAQEAVAVEQHWALPQGTFRLTKPPVAGQPRAPYKPPENSS